MTNKKNVCIKISLIFRVNPSKMVENGIFEVDREKVQTQDKRHWYIVHGVSKSYRIILELRAAFVTDKIFILSYSSCCDQSWREFKQ